jgi:hypothetical protein
MLGEIGSYASVMPVFLVTIIGGLSLIYRSGMRWSVLSTLMAPGYGAGCSAGSRQSRMRPFRSIR